MRRVAQGVWRDGTVGSQNDGISRRDDELRRCGLGRYRSRDAGTVADNLRTEEQRRTFLPGILAGEHVWCQGYSEPNAGSDLVSLRTTAERHGEHFKVNGRKIWTSYAQEATDIFMLVRTDRTARPAAGISFLLLDMKTPGITVRPIEDLRGDMAFCELTFDDVRVPAANLVGKLNQGWTIAKALLGFERLFIGSPAPVAHAMVQLRSLARERRLFDDAAFRARYSELELDLADLNALYNRFADILRRGEPVSADISMLKVYSTETWQRVAAFLSEAADEPGVCIESPRAAGEELQLLPPTFNALPSTIYGGSADPAQHPRPSGIGLASMKRNTTHRGRPTPAHPI